MTNPEAKLTVCYREGDKHFQLREVAAQILVERDLIYYGDCEVAEHGYHLNPEKQGFTLEEVESILYAIERT